MPEGDSAQGLFEQGAALHRAGELWAAVDCYRRAIQADSASAVPFNALGGALANLGEIKAAEEAFLKAIDKDPTFVDPLLHLARLWRLHGRLQEAEPLLLRALQLDERSFSVWIEYGAVLMLSNRFREAGEAFERALGLSPGDAMALHNLGRVAFETGGEKRAVALYRQALRQDPGLAACHTNLGIAQRVLGDFEAARSAFERALELEPLQAEAINGLVGLLELEGRYADALQRIEAAIKARGDPLLQLGAARVEHRMKRHDAAVQRLQKLKDSNLSENFRMQREFILGDVLDEMGRYDEAWAHYYAANKMKGVRFSPAEWSRHVDAIIAAFPGDEAREVARSKKPSSKPVFIVGMPRSGTSLAEQILASHSQVFGAGELTTLAMLVDEIPRRINAARPYPQCMPELSARRLTRLGRVYLDALDELSPAARRVTDKMWQNFEYLGLIERMLPGARVVHCSRNPLDTGLSCFFQNFAGQAGVPFSYDLAHIGAYYRDYARLMAHWRKVCVLPIYELSYETLVSEPEDTSRALIEFLGLPWEEACLSFHLNKRVVNTASVAQVKEPIYKRAVARHTHYDAYLQPLRQALDR